MKRRLSALFLSLLLVAALVAPGWSGTLDALPQWPDSAMYGVVNLEKPNEIVQRVVNSYLFKTITALDPGIKMAEEWLKQFPVTSASVVFGLGEKGFSMQGAIRFTDAKKDILARMAEGKGQEGDVDALINSPVPGELILAPMEGSTYAVVSGGGVAVALVSVEGDMILVGFTPEDLAAARDALKDGGRRMKLDRRLPQGNFFFFHDNGMAASELQAESDGVLKPPVGNLLAEAGINAADTGYDFSVFTNFAKVFSLLGEEKSGPMAPGDRILVGGGKPWFVFMGKVFLDKKHFQAVRDAAAAGDSDAAEFVKLLEDMKQFGLNEDAVLKILKNIGIVLGSQTKVMGNPLPGGYAYLSGEKAEVQLLLPLLEMVVRESGMPFETIAREGWTAFYALRQPVEFVMGIKDGVILAGFMTPEGMDAAPEISGRMAALYGNADLNGFLHLDAKVVRETILSLLNPEGPWAPLLAQEEDFVENVPLFLEGLKAAIEFKSLDILASDMERADFTILTEEARQEDIDAISAMAAKWSSMAEQGKEKEGQAGEGAKEEEKKP